QLAGSTTSPPTQTWVAGVTRSSSVSRVGCHLDLRRGRAGLFRAAFLRCCSLRHQKRVMKELLDTKNGTGSARHDARLTARDVRRGTAPSSRAHPGPPSRTAFLIRCTSPRDPPGAAGDRRRVFSPRAPALWAGARPRGQVGGRLNAWSLRAAPRRPANSTHGTGPGPVK